MIRWLKDLDDILRGETTRLSGLKDGFSRVPAAGLSIVNIVLGMIYGVCMGVFAVINREQPGLLQVFASMIKVPALFFLTLVVTFPSLYVFNALVGSRLPLMSMVRLLVASLGVNLAVLASFGPIVAFFSVTTANYPFMWLLNVVVFGVAGILGLTFLLQTLHRLSLLEFEPPMVEPVAEAAPADSPAPSEGSPLAPLLQPPEGALDRLPGHMLGGNVQTVFRTWVLVFALVGGQMAWVLRPFIGDPQQPFTWFRPRQSSFFEALWHTVQQLFRHSS